MSTPKILVRDYMKSLSLFFSEKDSVEKVAEILVKRRELGAPVLDEQHHLVGFITEQDCMREMLNGSYFGQEHLLAADIMTRDALHVSPDYDVVDLAEEMTQNKPKLYPVCKGKQVVGIISRSDVLRALTKVRHSSKNHI